MINLYKYDFMEGRGTVKRSTVRGLIKDIFFPHRIFIWAMLPISTALLVMALTGEEPLSFRSFICYFVALYEVLLICLRIPSISRHYKSLKANNVFVYKYTSDPSMRVRYSLYMNIIVNTGFAIFHLWLGVYHNSFWYLSLAFYYILLDIIRFVLLMHLRGSGACEDLILEHKRSRMCGLILAVMEIALAVIVVFIVYRNKGAVHAPLTTMAMTAYTACTFTIAIVNLIRYRKYRSPIISMAKALSLTSASVSILATETAIFNSFGSNAGSMFRRNITAITGIALCCFVLIFAVGTIIYSTVQIYLLKKNKCPPAEEK